MRTKANDMRKSVVEQKRVPLPPRTPELEARVFSKVEKQRGDGCWLWTGVLRGGGYGAFRYRGRTVSVHRLVYEWFVAPIPHDLVIDHKCRVRHCCNPQHLDVVTDTENRRRGESPLARAWRRWDEWERRGRCGQGHDLSVHLRRYPGSGARYCWLCNRERLARWRASRPDYAQSYYQAHKKKILAQKRARDAKRR